MKYIVRTDKKTLQGNYHYLCEEGLTGDRLRASEFDTREEASAMRKAYLRATGRDVTLEIDEA